MYEASEKSSESNSWDGWVVHNHQRGDDTEEEVRHTADEEAAQTWAEKCKKPERDLVLYLPTSNGKV